MFVDNISIELPLNHLNCSFSLKARKQNFNEYLEEKKKKLK